MVLGEFKDAKYIHNPKMYFDNTYKGEWLESDIAIRIAKDVAERMEYITHFPVDSFDIKIVNTGETIHTPYELVEKVIMERLLD